MHADKSDSLIFRELMILLIRDVLKDTRFSKIFVGTTLSNNVVYPAVTVNSKFNNIVPFEAGVEEFNIFTGVQKALVLDKIDCTIATMSNNDEEAVSIAETVAKGIKGSRKSYKVKAGTIKILTDQVVMGNVEPQSAGENKLFECKMTVVATWEQIKTRGN